MIHDFEYKGAAEMPYNPSGYDGWSNQQLVDKALDCLYIPSHKLL